MKAWVSGAYAWTAAQREALANDLTRPQLIAVSARCVECFRFSENMVISTDVLLPALTDQNVGWVVRLLLE